MAVDPDASDPLPGGWRLLATHDWTDTTALEASLSRALETLDGASTEVVLYEYVDVEALRDALSPGTDRGVSEVRFECGRHEVRVADDGTIAAR